MREAVVLSIGTTHPWNIAGVGLDLLAGAELATRILTVVAAVSAQDADGVRALEALSTDVLRAQLTSLPWQAIAAVRVGALPSVAAVEVVAETLSARNLPAVVDPVFFASRGGALTEDGAISAIRETLGTLPNVILTPNLAEAALLLGRARVTRDDLEAAAAELRMRGAAAVLLKGGHLDGDPVDVLAMPEQTYAFPGERIAMEMRGTGCVLAIALACGLARGDALLDAVHAARTFVRRKIASSREFGGLRVAY